MSVRKPIRESAPSPHPAGATSSGRRAILELARIYVSSSAHGSALEVLDRLPSNGWDEDARLLRAEAMIGLGLLPEAEKLLGPPMLPGKPNGSERAKNQNRSGGRQNGLSRMSVDPFSPVIPKREDQRAKSKPPSRRERLSLWRFLLHLRILHRTGRYREVLEFGRAFLGRNCHRQNIYLARITVVMAQSMLALRKPSDARNLYEEIVDLYKSLNSREGVADSLLGIANTHLLDCHWDEADAVYQECRYRYEELGLSDKSLACQINLGVLRTKRGDLVGGRTLLLQALARAGQGGELRRLTTIHLGLAMTEIRSGAYTAARRHLLAGLRLARRSRTPRAQALALEFLGELYMIQGELTRARRCLEIGLAKARSIAPTGDIVFEIRRRQAEIALREGRLEEARVLALDSCQSARRYGDAFESAVAQRVLAEVAEAEGNLEGALEITVGVCDVLDRLGETFERARVEVVRIRIEHGLRRLPSSAFEVRIRELCRPYESMPDSPILAEARAAASCIENHMPVFTAEQTREGVASSGKQERQDLTEEDLRTIHALGMMTQDAGFLQTLALAKRVAPLSVPVLILGEPGSGRRQLARLVHSWSGRAGIYAPFHCANVPGHILETELFGQDHRTVGLDGHGKGGVLVAASSGTVFLDEVGDLPASTQAVFLKWMERAESQSEFSEGASVLGGRSDVRILSSMSPDRAEPTKSMRAPAATLREDLHYRLARVVLEVPPLRRRRDDVPLLIDHYFKQAEEQYGCRPPGLSGTMIRSLQDRPWTGNSRELREAVDRILGPWKDQARNHGRNGDSIPMSDLGPVEVRARLDRCSWNLAAAARGFGTSRSSLYRYLRRHGIQRPA